MSRRFVPPPPEVVAELRRVAERRLGAEEFEAWVRAPMGDDERRAVEELIDWFMRRYPTPAARLAQARTSHRAAELLMPRPPREGRGP